MMNPKIQDAQRKVLNDGETPIATFQTSLKPNFGTPTLWFTLTNSRLILFSTLRGGKVFQTAGFNEINSVVLEQNGRVLKILMANPEHPDMAFAFADFVPSDDISQCYRGIVTRLGEAKRPCI